MKRCWRTFWPAGLPCFLAGIAAAAGVAAAPGIAAGADRYVVYTGTAMARHSDAFLYGEKHVLRYAGDRLAERVVLYTCQNGAPFARKTVSYDELLNPDFLLDDVSTGMREGVRSRGAAREVFFRGDRVESEKTRALLGGPAMVADTGFDEFVRKNWQPLMAGEALSMDFLVPSRLAVMQFKVQHIRADRVDGTAVELFRLNLSGVLGWVLPAIDVYYGAGDHLLMRYVGLSDLRDASHNNFQAEISFHSGDRKPGGGTGHGWCA